MLSFSTTIFTKTKCQVSLVVQYRTSLTLILTVLVPSINHFRFTNFAEFRVRLEHWENAERRVHVPSRSTHFIWIRNSASCIAQLQTKLTTVFWTDVHDKRLDQHRWIRLPAVRSRRAKRLTSGFNHKVTHLHRWTRPLVAGGQADTYRQNYRWYWYTLENKCYVSIHHCL